MKKWSIQLPGFSRSDQESTQGVGSTLDESCDRFVGQKLIVAPHGGYGWIHEQAGLYENDQGVPPPFRVRVERIYTYLGERRGIVGRVVEPGFAYDDYWIVSMTRHQGEWNFTNRIAHYNFFLSRAEPTKGVPQDVPEDARHWPVFDYHNSLDASGYGRLAEDIKWCELDDLQRAQQHLPNAEFHRLGTIVCLPSSSREENDFWNRINNVVARLFRWK